ncbi:hypothetical protein Prede_2358 [Prevotella dentalis DSM 3688]|uniref:Uncharacterized protein n=1 Tax=Prevotella dentalis (strain ATCC 49559 / DSM 3688 / JCM 13448 / NCTC 12043 / ES 2772) TaxID=908937 RepID=F9D6I4_PREDD|nr:hypothetical protein [Prevotella dentalis]AGB29622.1 hypothetical protein Prede_2358 [Prevotella dentalis DSM 3688]EGQ11901.1 hypothetical protein HMPREF9136_2462 [Prevotella dentalis DSM 3688]
MNTPNIRYYAKLVNTTQKGKKTPKYTIVEQAGYYPPMEQLRGRDGLVSMNLMPQSREDKSSTPPMRLQAKNSLNFTGLKDFWIEGKLSGFAYGYPMDKPTYSKDEKPNPFYEYKGDGYLFRVYQDEKEPTNLTPTCIELVVLEGAKVLISAYCKQLKMGGFDEALEALRQQAQKG